MQKYRLFAAALTLLFLFLCCPIPMKAQVVTGTIEGTVKDVNGAVISGASVTVTNTDQNVTVRTATTDAAGNYTAQLLPVGHYSVTATAPGFQGAEKTGIMVDVNAHVTANLSLKVGSTQQKVTVTTAPLQVDLQSAQAQTIITGTQVRELSLSTRNYEQLVTLMPGVTAGDTDQIYIGVSNPAGTSNQINFSLNGGRPTQNIWNIDGADNVDRGANLTLLTFPSVDSIQQFSVQRGEYGAEYGRSSSGQINVITKAGTSRFHGDLYDFFRNNDLNANNYFNNQANIPIPALRYNDFGGTIGGPIVIPKLYNPANKKSFFFFSEESRRVITYTTFIAAVPTANERAGIFPQPVCVQFNANGVCTMYSNTVTNINPAAQAYLKDIVDKEPLPAPGCTSGCSSTSVGRNIFNADQQILRLDQVFSPKFSVFGMVENDRIPTQEPGGLFTGSALPGVSTTSTNAPGVVAVIHVTNAFSPTFLNDGGYAYSQGAVFSTPIGTGDSKNSPDVGPTIKLPFVSTLGRVPSLNFTYFSSITGFGPYRDINDNNNVFDNITKIFGQHTLKFGVTYNWYQKRENAGGGNQGAFGFYINDGTPTGASSEFQEFASFLTGNVANFGQTSQDYTAVIQQQGTELYAQDQWRMRPNFTLTYGVRYTAFRQPTDANGNLSNFDPGTYNPANAPQINPFFGTLVAGTGKPFNGLIFGGKNSPYGGAVAQQNNHDFAPRVGFAWDPFGNGKMSVRAGYGIYYDQEAVSRYESTVFGNPPLVTSTNIFNTNLQNPASVSASVGSFPSAITAIGVNWKTPYSEEWSFDVQQQLTPSTVFDIGYYGSDSHHLAGIVDINQPLPGQYVTALAPYGVTPPVSYSTTPQLNYIRPYRGYDAINSQKTVFGANYHSLQTSLQHRFPNNSFLNLNYTWSHANTDAVGDFATPQNSYNIHGEYGPAQFDQRHVFNANYTYVLPFYTHQHGIVGHLLGGWQLSGIVNLHTGGPATVYNFLNDPAGQGIIDGNSFAAGRPDQISDPNEPNAASGPIHNFKQWFNTAAFALVPANQARPGDAHNGSVRGPGYEDWDASLMKNTNITKDVSTQFRAESFNTFNHTNPSGFGTAFALFDYGVINSTRDPRILQLALKLYF